MQHDMMDVEGNLFSVRYHRAGSGRRKIATGDCDPVPLRVEIGLDDLVQARCLHDSSSMQAEQPHGVAGSVSPPSAWLCRLEFNFGWSGSGFAPGYGQRCRTRSSATAARTWGCEETLVPSPAPSLLALWKSQPGVGKLTLAMSLKTAF